MDNKKIPTWTGAAVIIIFAVTVGAYLYYFEKNNWQESENNSEIPISKIKDSQQRKTACTEEAMQCPDGSYVSRTGPNCEFAPCPEINNDIFWRSVVQIDEYPDNRNPKEICENIKEKENIKNCRLIDYKKSNDRSECVDGMSIAGCFACKFECLMTNDERANNFVGNDRDDHGCIGSAGYSWCEEKQKCLRSWEESCSNSTLEDWKKYRNENFKFELTLDEEWKGYRVSEESGNFGETNLRFWLPTADKNWHNIEADPMVISIFSPDAWEKQNKQEGPKPVYLIENGGHIFGYSFWQDCPVDLCNKLDLYKTVSTIQFFE